jgi:hypothetical protein
MLTSSVDVVETTTPASCMFPFNDPISLSKFRYILYNNLLFEQYTWSYKIQKYSYDISIILNYDYFAEQIDFMVTLFLRKRDVNLYKIWLSINHIMARQGEEK